jgi:hypothetical protein
VDRPAEREWITVRCHEGRRRRERPRAVVIDGPEDEVVKELATWIDQTADGARTRYFTVQLASGREYTIAHDLTLDRWYLHAVIPGARARNAPAPPDTIH